MIFTAIVLNTVDGAVVLFQCSGVTGQHPNVTIKIRHDNGLKRDFQDEYSNHVALTNTINGKYC
jgi:hypothetical protein